MSPEVFAEAHKTLSKIFGNIIADPTNEKFRSLKKANAVVQDKLRHPACVQALLLCGFQDTGDTYVCRANADLSLMRQFTSSLKAYDPLSATPASSSAPAKASGSGVRMVNGTIV